MNFADFIKQGFKLRGEKIIGIKRVKTSGNISFLIKTDEFDYIIRLSGERERSRTKEEVSAETELLDFLTKEKFPVPSPIKLNSQRVLITNKGCGICYKLLEGHPVEEPSPEKYFLAGKILGRIHRQTRDFKFPSPRKSWGLETTQEKFLEIKEEIKNNKELEKNNFSERFEKEIKRMKFSNRLPKGILHEDLGKRHILFNDNKISGIIDWDRSYCGFLILDLGQAIRGWCFDNWTKLNRRKLNSFLEGYNDERKLNMSEKFYLKKAIKFAFLERALSFIIKFLNGQRKEDLEFATINLGLSEEI